MIAMFNREFTHPSVISPLVNSSLHNLRFPRYKLNNYGLRAFSVAAPAYIN